MSRSTREFEPTTEAEVIDALRQMGTEVAKQALGDIEEGYDVFGTWENVAYSEAVPAMRAFEEAQEA